MVLNLCTSPYDALYLVYICIKFHENIFDGIKVIKRTQFSSEKIRRGIISKNVDGVMFIFLCTSPDGGFICPKFYENILNGIKVIEWT